MSSEKTRDDVPKPIKKSVAWYTSWYNAILVAQKTTFFYCMDFAAHALIIAYTETAGTYD